MGLLAVYEGFVLRTANRPNLTFIAHGSEYPE